MPTQVNCPTCNRVVEWSDPSPSRPFCSERCRLVDLGAWVDGSHRIPGDPAWDDIAGGEPDPDQPPAND